MEKNFVRVRSIKDIVISCALTVSGCVLIAMPTATSINVLGFFLIFTGVLLFMILRTAYKDEATGMKYSKKERYFAQVQRADLVEKISGNPDGIDITEEDKGNAVRLDIYFSKESGKAYLQVLEYVPYKYEPCSEMVEHEISAVSRIK